ncbi:hypothetical protein J2S70_000873 [Trueperella bonasi]|uniref:Uncharacterized protein n=1 Tax=Trueperella bonasi TaxID=312286 RepID=A0ABT9NFX0_9ACTO|nr:hypothetical protein [Trueperella bonasi]MDP9806291.1 hypothetical protein [Trueperella bonasi]
MVNQVATQRRVRINAGTRLDTGQSAHASAEHPRWHNPEIGGRALGAGATMAVPDAAGKVS